MRGESVGWIKSRGFYLLLGLSYPNLKIKQANYQFISLPIDLSRKLSFFVFAPDDC
jgi:hypothetical protein